jgi:hypothetical protein
MAQGDSEEEGDEGDTGSDAAAAQARSKQTQEKNAVEEMERKLKALEAEYAVLKKVMHRLFHAHGSYMQSAWQGSSAEDSASVVPKRRRYASKAQAKAARAPPSVVPVNVRPEDSLLKLVAPKASGDIVHALQPRVVPEIIARCWMRWWNAEANE